MGIDRKISELPSLGRALANDDILAVVPGGTGSVTNKITGANLLAGASGDNIYTANGTLSGDRVVEGDSHDLSINNTTNFTVDGGAGNICRLEDYATITLGANNTLNLTSTTAGATDSTLNITSTASGTGTATLALSSEVATVTSATSFGVSAPTANISTTTNSQFLLNGNSTSAQTLNIRAANAGTGNGVLDIQAASTGGIGLLRLRGDEVEFNQGNPNALNIFGGNTQFQHEIALGFVSVTSDTNTTTVNTCIIGVDDTSVARTVTLSNADKSAGKMFIIKDQTGGASTNNITVTPETGTIDGAASIPISVNFGVLQVYSNGTNWFTL